MAALNALRHHCWPGNLAELESVVRNLALGSLEEDIALEDVERVLTAHAGAAPPPEIALDRPYREALSSGEALEILRQEAMHGWIDASLVWKFSSICQMGNFLPVRGRSMLASYYA